MCPPNLHIFHPQEEHLYQWLAELQECLKAEASWDACTIHRRQYNKQAAFDVPTEADLVLKRQGPVILVQKVQFQSLDRFRKLVSRKVSVYHISVTCPTDLLSACEEARAAFISGEPLIPKRELIAYLIVSKLAKQDKWAGDALNKNFLWSSDLPKGGFPKDIVEDKEIFETADALFKANVLCRKLSQREQKYGLAHKSIVDPILETRTFDNVPTLSKFFERSSALVPAKLLYFNE